MRIPLDKIIVGKFRVREKLDDEHIEEIAESFKQDGQWEPIIVRPSREKVGYYELIAGEHRVEAAKRIGWKDIEATVKDVDDVEAGFLAIKTNLIRRGTSEVEEGQAIYNYMTKYNLDQKTVAKKLGKDESWVSRRLALVLKICDEVREALLDGSITYTQAVIISQISPKKGELKPEHVNKQKQLLKIILEKQRKKKKRLCFL